MNEELNALFVAIQEVVENLPMGGIGVNGPTQSEIDEACESGHPIENDSAYHIGQQVWLLAEQGKTVTQRTADNELECEALESLPPPFQIMEAAERVRVWMEENGHKNWKLLGICDRRLVE